MAVEGDYLVFAGTEKQGATDAQVIVIDDPATTAAVLLELAKTVLQRTEESSKRTVLLEAGLLEANSLRESSNDLKSLKVSKDEDKVDSGSDEAPMTGKLTSTATKLMSEGGIPEDKIRYLGTKTWYIKILNSSANPAKAARTMMAKPKFEGQYQGWLKNNAAPAVQPLSAEEMAEIKGTVATAESDVYTPDPELCIECFLDKAMEGHELCLQCRLAKVQVSDTDGLEA
jgi:hypothetical protein